MTVRTPFIRAIRQALKRAAVPGDAAPMQAYMKSEMPFYGIKKPLLKAALKPVLAAYPFEGWNDLHDTSLALWREATYREERYAVLELLRLRCHKSHLTPKALPMYEEMITIGAWWDLVDEIAAHQVGAILMSDPKAVGKIMRTWSTCHDLWKRRASILCQLRLKGETNTTLLAACMRPSLSSKEFFLRKAIGWALRDYARTDPDWVRDYVATHDTQLSPLSKREALKHLSVA